MSQVSVVPTSPLHAERPSFERVLGIYVRLGKLIALTAGMMTLTVVTHKALAALAFPFSLNVVGSALMIGTLGIIYNKGQLHHLQKISIAVFVIAAITTLALCLFFPALPYVPFIFAVIASAAGSHVAKDFLHYTRSEPCEVMKASEELLVDVKKYQAAVKEGDISSAKILRKTVAPTAAL